MGDNHSQFGKQSKDDSAQMWFKLLAQWFHRSILKWFFLQATNAN